MREKRLKERIWKMEGGKGGVGEILNYKKKLKKACKT